MWTPVAAAGLQMLLSVAAGWLIARMRLMEAPGLVRLLNELVFKLCLPSMQLWLLAIKTDLRSMDWWWAVSVYLLWSLVVQLGCILWALYREGGDMRRMGMHMLALTANNTGIIGPIIIEAAAGTKFAVLGILGTAAMYFQQLPLAALLFEAHRWGLFSGKGARCKQGGRQQQEQQQQQQQQQHEQKHDCGDDGNGAGLAAADKLVGEQRLRLQGGSTAGTGVCAGSNLGSVASPSSPSSSASFFAQFLVRNPVMWATGLGVLLSFLGLHDVLDPDGSSFQPGLGFIEGWLGWFGRCTTPLTLLSAGAWMHGRSLSASHKRQVVAYAALRLLVLPALMAIIVMGCRLGRGASVSLVVMASVPIAQVAYLVSEQYGVNTEAVTSLMIVGLVVLLPHMLLLLGLFDALGVFAAS